MKTLLVLRHGKSSWSSPDLSDHDRPLKNRGRRDSDRMGTELRDRDLVPDLVLSSTARRARSTARRAAAEAGCGDRIVETGGLYLSSVAGHLEVIAEHAGDAHERVMVVAHNPTLEDLVEHLTGEDARLTTANLACVDLDVDSWGDLAESRGALRFVLRPKELPRQVP